MRTVSVSSLLIAVALAATTTNLPAEQTVLTAVAANQDCPVDFSLQKNSHTGAVRSVQGPDQQRSDAAAKRSVEVRLSSLDGRIITGANITVSAPKIGNRATPARVIYGQTAEPDSVTKTYHLTQDKAAKGPLTGDLELLDTMAGVESASIRSVTYGDGSTWLPVNGAACVSAPRMYMEVAGR